MNLPDARRELNELRAAHTEQPRNIDVAFQARTETVDANAAVLADVLVALVEMEPLVTRTAPAGVVMGTGRKRKWYPTSEPASEWRAQGYVTTDPRVGFRPTEAAPTAPRPFTLPVRARQTFGDVA